MYEQPASLNAFEPPSEIPLTAPQFSRTQAFYCQQNSVLLLQAAQEKSRYEYLMISPLCGVRAAVLPLAPPRSVCVHLARDRAYKDCQFKQIEYDAATVQSVLDYRAERGVSRQVHALISGFQLFVPLTRALEFVSYAKGGAEVLYVESHEHYAAERSVAFFGDNPGLKALIYVRKTVRKPSFQEVILRDVYNDCCQALAQQGEHGAFGSVFGVKNCPPAQIQNSVFTFVEITVAFRKRTPDSVIHQPFPMPKFECCVFTDETRRWIQQKLENALHYELGFYVDTGIEQRLSVFNDGAL